MCSMVGEMSMLVFCEGCEGGFEGGSGDFEIVGVVVEEEVGGGVGIGGVDVEMIVVDLYCGDFFGCL